MANIFYFQWEVTFIEFLQANLGEGILKLLSFISNFGDDLVLVLILGFTYWAYDKKKGLRLGMTIMLNCMLFPMIKNLVKRKRPYMVHDSIECLKPVSDGDIMDVTLQGYSFPSGHSANSAAAFGALARFFGGKVLLVLAVLMPLLVGFSRPALGVHYPTDVLAGWTIGYASVFLFAYLEKKIKNQDILYWGIFIAALPGMIYCRSNDYFSNLGMMLGLILGNMFERKYVNFPETKNLLAMILRTIGGVAIYFGLNTVLKMPFSAEFLESATMLQFLFRFARYAIIVFVELGIYPMLFGKFSKKSQ